MGFGEKCWFWERAVKVVVVVVKVGRVVVGRLMVDKVIKVGKVGKVVVKVVKVVEEGLRVVVRFVPD